MINSGMESIKSKIKKSIYNAFPATFKLFLAQEIVNRHDYLRFINTSFSQEGEDIILSQLFYGRTNGFYLDIGAHQPIQYSNTYRFYLNGWRGINIDAMPGSMDEFNKLRPGDTNLEAAISNWNEILTYYMFKAAGLNTFSREHAVQMEQNGYQLGQVVQIQTTTMNAVLDKYLPKNQQIDFLSLDVEGLELAVLQSNNWSKYRPTILLVESLDLKNKDVLRHYLTAQQYNLVAQTVNNLYFKNSR